MKRFFYFILAVFLFFFMIKSVYNIHEAVIDDKDEKVEDYKSGFIK